MTTPLLLASPWVVEVNEAKVSSTTAGSVWWQIYRLRFKNTNRITDRNCFTPVGGYATVACDDEDSAHWLAGHMAAMGLPATAVKVKRLRQCPTCPGYLPGSSATCNNPTCLREGNRADAALDLNCED